MGVYFLLANKSFPRCQTEFTQQLLIFLQQISYKSVPQEGHDSHWLMNSSFLQGVMQHFLQIHENTADISV